MSDTTITIKRSTPKETPEQRARKRLIQFIASGVVLVLYILLAAFVQTKNPQGAFILLIGLGFGYILQRSRFCFTASMRDPVLTGSTSLTKAVIIALAISSVGYMALQMKATGLSLEKLGTDALKSVTQLPGHVRDAGVHTVLGGFLFGIGAVIAGGCASGTFMRMGEGFVQQWIVFIFFIIGSVIGMAVLPAIKSVPFLYQATPVYLPKLLGGWIPAIIFQFGMLFILYIIADIYGKKKSGEL
ncbi:MAG TPA: YeeE/YedE thiosulfate transporter family protein [Spirochaetia bacterium]|nr:YeeE/YedE thiosulfate transporter family protein [Spirochaetales bacterium]HRS64620.1 YeeE/YedE thiosulfate transporter family protein [Spirochaetia bacterium]HOT60491.1 YeeE/YedE thiosulfate transporter family protein [Spirochaetales bacterium]HPD80860.1 YeeE/YedE thiosulfate transporter family protein [Spirochaetales bacterium]HQG40027.1 YeeE/YedE thiosulfate transporter family protein [Spirochaetales bacterium]